MMGIKVDSEAVLKHIKRIRKRYDSKDAERVEIGVTDRDIAEYATYVEYGWVQRVTVKQQKWFRAQGIEHPPKAGAALVNPPRPFLRGTMKAEGKKWIKVLQRALKRDFSPTQALALVGEQASQDVRTTIARGGTSEEKFPERSGITMELYSPPKSKRKLGKNQAAVGGATRTQPLVLTGKLLNAIRFDVK